MSAFEHREAPAGQSPVRIAMISAIYQAGDTDRAMRSRMVSGVVAVAAQAYGGEHEARGGREPEPQVDVGEDGLEVELREP